MIKIEDVKVKEFYKSKVGNILFVVEKEYSPKYKDFELKFTVNENKEIITEFFDEEEDLEVTSVRYIENPLYERLNEN